jgi:hypothetical protein
MKFAKELFLGHVAIERCLSGIERIGDDVRWSFQYQSEHDYKDLFGRSHIDPCSMLRKTRNLDDEKGILMHQPSTLAPAVVIVFIPLSAIENEIELIECL